MHFFIQVSKDSQYFTVDDHFDHAIVPADRFSDFQTISLSEVIFQSLYLFNRQNIFDPHTLTVFEDTYCFSYAICEGGYSYSFSCYRIFDKASEVIDFLNSFSSDAAIQFKLHLAFQDVISKFSFDPSFKISAVDVSDMIEGLLVVNHN